MVVPQVHAYSVADICQQHQTVEIADAVTPRLCANQLQRLAAVGLDLSRNSFRSGGLQDVNREIPFSHEESEGRNLKIVVGAMIVLRCRFIAPISAFEHPLEKLCKPLFKIPLIRFGPRLRASQQPDSINHACQPASFDQADAAPGVHARDRLRVLEIRIHSRRGIDKPRTQ